MEPTEHELTVAVDAAARTNWDVHRRLIAKFGEIEPVFDSLPAVRQHQLRDLALEIVREVLAALPDRAEAERRRIGTYLVGDGSWSHHDNCIGPPTDWRQPCSCGLDDLLEQLREVDPL